MKQRYLLLSIMVLILAFQRTDAKIVYHYDKDNAGSLIFDEDTIRYEGITYKWHSGGCTVYYDISGKVPTGINIYGGHFEALEYDNIVENVHLLGSLPVNLVVNSVYFRYEGRYDGFNGFDDKQENKLGVTFLPNQYFPVTSYSDDLFQGKSSLVTVTLPGEIGGLSQRYFEGDENLKKVIISDGVRYIDNYAFMDCPNLESVAIPKSVIRLGISLFTRSYALKELIVEEGNEKFDSRNGCNAIIESSTNTLVYGSAGTTVIPNGIKTIKDGAFTTKYNLVSIIIPESVEVIERAAFSNCTGLESIIIPDRIKKIDEYVFSGCTSLATVKLSNNLESIGYYSFGSCKSLTSINLPQSMMSIGKSAFSGCSGLETIIINDGLSSIGESAFSGCSSLTSVTIPVGIKSIEGYTFNRCSKLESVSLPEGLESVGNSAFYQCRKLSSINLPSTLKTIGKSSFEGCIALESIIIPKDVESIGSSAFSATSHLTSVTIGSATPLEITSNTFYNRANATLYVPFGSKEAYQAADYWKEFKEIVEMPGEKKGDVNGDGKVTITDAVAIISYIRGENTQGFNISAADFNGDEQITLADAVMVIDSILKAN